MHKSRLTNYMNKTTGIQKFIAWIWSPFQRFGKWWSDGQKCSIMTINYKVDTNHLECIGWGSNTISPFCGALTPELWSEIREYCKDRTSVYSWVGGHYTKGGRYIAFGEPASPYLEDIELLKVGQGFHKGIQPADWYEKMWNGKDIKKCPTCNHVIRDKS